MVLLSFLFNTSKSDQLHTLLLIYIIKGENPQKGGFGPYRCYFQFLKILKCLPFSLAWFVILISDTCNSLWVKLGTEADNNQRISSWSLQ